MNFLFPGFLFALAAVAIPVIIHLFNFRKFKKVYFTNVRLLKSAEQQNSSRQKLRNRLILAARVLAIVFMVLAFARPYLATDKDSAAKNAMVSVYIDNSYSMETVNRDGSLLDEARRRAKEIAMSYGLNDKFQLLTSDFEGRHQRLLNRDEFLKAVDDVKTGSNFKTVGQVIERQADVFTKEPGAQKFSYLVSDFQNNVIPAQSFKLQDSSLNLRFVKLSSATVPNVSVDSVWFTSPIHRTGTAEKLIVRLKNNGDKEAKNIPLKLLVNNVQKAIATVTIAGESTRTDTLSFSGLDAGWQQGLLSIKDYPVVFDDNFYFSFNVLAELPVLVINGGGSNKYIDAVYKSDPFFKVTNVSAGAINYSALPDYPFIVLNEVTDFTAGFNQQLKAYLEKGGHVFLFPSVNGSLPALTTFLQSVRTDLPGEIVNEENKVAKINLNHPIFKDAFEHVPRNLELPVATKFINYTSSSGALKEAVLDFAGGNTFLAAYKAGKGKIYLSAVPADEKASNLVRHSVFIPVMYQSALSGLQTQTLYYTIGRSQAVETSRITAGADQKLVLKGKDFEVIPDIRQTENNTNLYIADQVKIPGSYSLLKADSLISVFSFNDDKSESELKYASAGEIKRSVDGKNVQFFEPQRTSLQKEIKAADSGIQLWKVCLVLSLIFLAAEILLLRLLKNKQLKTSSV